MHVLEAINVTKDFREGSAIVHAVRGATLALSRGQIVVLEGPSGSGKTTLLSILGCILTPSSGAVIVEGEAVKPRRPARLATIRKRSFGFIFQQYNLLPALSAKENVEYALNVRGHRGRRARREAERVIRLVGLWDRRYALPRDLSGGQKQRVAIARALAGHAPIMLADEPTANLDAEMGEQVLELFRQLVVGEDRALLIVTHDPKVRRFADRVLKIHDGYLLN